MQKKLHKMGRDNYQVAEADSSCVKCPQRKRAKHFSKASLLENQLRNEPVGTRNRKLRVGEVTPGESRTDDQRETAKLS